MAPKKKQPAPLPPDWTLTYHIHVSDEDLPLKGYFVEAGASEYAEENAKLEKELAARLDRGDTWAWCQVTVIAKLLHPTYGNVWIGEAHLGACSYKDEADFRSDAYFEDMKREALADLRSRMGSAAASGRHAERILKEMPT